MFGKRRAERAPPLIADVRPQSKANVVDSMTAIRFVLASQAICGALLLFGLLIAAFMSDREVAGAIISFSIGLPLVVIFALSTLASTRVLMKGESRDRIRLGIWYALIVVLFCLFALFDIPNKLTSALIFIPFAAAAFVLPAVWLMNS